jgi:hypothetical protein
LSVVGSWLSELRRAALPSSDNRQPTTDNRTGLIATVFLCIIGSHAAHAADARAWLDRNSMHVGETVTLNVEISGDTGASQPDLAALKDDFDMLATQSSSSVNIVNGQTSSKLLWAVGLQPKHAGTLTIPSFTVGGARTEPLKLTVLPAPAGAVGKAGDDLFVQVDAQPRQPYVQQEIRLTVKLYYAMSLIDGNLDDPKAEGLVVRKLGQDSNYVADVDGRRYRVVERHYAASAENSGSLALPPIVFRGRGLDPGDVNSFFSRGRSVSAQSEPIALDVRPRPAASGSDAWLPAQSLTLSVDGVEPGKAVHAGEPLTLTLRLKAQGLGFEQLPELKLPTIDGADVYPDKETTQNRDDGSWLYGTRERKFALVPKRAGTLALPAFTIEWWDTAHDKAQVSEVAAQTIDVLAAATSGALAPAPPPVSVTAPTAAPNPAPPAFAPIGGSAELELRRWQWIALGAGVLWLVTIAAAIVWLLRRRRALRRAALLQPRAAAPSAGMYEFRSACARGELRAAARALLRRAQRDRPALRNLGELAREVADAEQAAAIRALERALYGSGGADAALGRRLGDAFANGPTFPAVRHENVDAGLPELYPFRI